jgi:hypothetical protein
MDPSIWAAENVAEAVANAANFTENAASAAENAADAIDTGEDVSWCALARREMTGKSCTDLQQQRDSLEEGVSAFDPPHEMTRGHVTRIGLAIGATEDAVVTVRSVGGTAGVTPTAPVKIGRYMAASLTGSAFDIVPVGDPKRDLGMSSNEFWEWDVTPKKEGAQTLQVSIEAFAQDDKGDRTRIKLYQSPPVSVTVLVSKQDKTHDAIDDIKGQVDDTTGLMKSVRAWLIALAGVAGAIGLVVWYVRNIGKKPPKGDSDKDGSDESDDGAA